MPVPVTNVIFDLGGVLIDWDPRHLYRQLFAGDDAGMEQFLEEVCTPAWNHELDRGGSFAEAVAELGARHPARRDLIDAYHARWLEMVAGPIPGTVEILEGLDAREVPLFAITNWSAETFALVRQDPTFGFLDRFRAIFVSGELRLVKPEPEIFHHAMEAIAAAPEACLFIDDVAANIAAAAALGLATHHFTEPEALRADLARRGLLA